MLSVACDRQTAIGVGGGAGAASRRAEEATGLTVNGDSTVCVVDRCDIDKRQRQRQRDRYQSR